MSTDLQLSVSCKVF